MKMILMLVSAAALTTAAGAEPTVVATGETPSIVRVTYDDLNLGSERGRKRLTDRVTAAVRSMCKDDNVDSLKVEMAEQRCYTASIIEAGDQINQLLRVRPTGLAGGPQPISIARR